MEKTRREGKGGERRKDRPGVLELEEELFDVLVGQVEGFGGIWWWWSHRETMLRVMAV